MAQKPRFKPGDRVRITDRPATANDLKSGMFFNHFRGLVGTVQRMYGSEAAVDVELESLPEDVWKRHMQARDQMRARWLEGLAADVQRKLTPAQKQFELRYVVLVSSIDLEKRRPDRSRKAAA